MISCFLSFSKGTIPGEIKLSDKKITPQRRQGKWSDKEKDKESENNGESIRFFNNQNQRCWHHAEGMEALTAMAYLVGELKWDEYGANHNP